MNDRILKNRLWHLRQLVKSAGGNNAAASIIGVRPSYITAIAGPNPSRTVGDRMAAKIERCFGMEPGALDADPPKQSNDSDPHIAEIVSTMANCTVEDKEFVLAISQWIAARSTANNATATHGGNIDLGEIADSVISYDKSNIETLSGNSQTSRAVTSTRNPRRIAIEGKKH